MEFPLETFQHLAEADLGSTFRAIQRKAIESGLQIVLRCPKFAEAGPPVTPMVFWKDDWQDYLDLAVKADCTFLYVELEKFDLGELLSEAIGEDDSASYSEEEPDTRAWLRQRLEDASREWEGRQGEPAAYRSVWFRDGVAHVLSARADWAIDCEESIIGVIEQAAEIERHAKIAASGREAAYLYRLSEELARHPRFSEATSDAKRQFMAGKLFPTQANPARIAELASLIYWWDVEPSERVSRSERARALYASGESVRAIAALLKISEPKVRAALELGSVSCKPSQMVQRPPEAQASQQGGDAPDQDALRAHLEQMDIDSLKAQLSRSRGAAYKLTLAEYQRRRQQP